MKILQPAIKKQTGSGSTGVACQNLDRDFIGIEIDEKYFEIAEKRLNECVETTIFDK